MSNLLLFIKISRSKQNATATATAYSRSCMLPPTHLLKTNNWLLSMQIPALKLIKNNKIIIKALIIVLVQAQG